MEFQHQCANISPKSSPNPSLVPPHSITSPGTTTSTSVCDFSPGKGICVNDSRDNGGAKTRKFIEVIQEKDLGGNIGRSLTNQTVKDNVDSGEILVCSVQPNGPAEWDGQLKCNNRILAVDGTTVMGLGCKDVHNRIWQSEEPTAKLLLFQRSQTSSVKDQTSPASGNFDAKLPTSSSCPKLSIKPSRVLSSSTNDLDSTKDLEPKSVTKSYFDHSYIPERHVSTPNIFNSIYQTEDEFISADTNHSASVELIDEPQHDSKDKFSNGIKQTLFPTRPSQVLTKKIPSMKGVYLKKTESSNNTVIPASTTSLSTSYNSTDQLFTNLSHSENWTLLSKNSWNFKNRRPNEKFFECVLTKIQGSFGLNIIGGIDTKKNLGGVYVKSLQPGGAAQQNGTIRKNDRILSINGVSLEDRYHQQAVCILHDASDRGILVLGRIIEEEPHGNTTSDTLEHSMLPMEYGFYGNVPQSKVDTELDPNKTKPLPNPTSTTPTLTSPPLTETMAKTSEVDQLNPTQEFISKKESPETCCDLPKTYVGATRDNKVFKESPILKEECNSSTTCEDHKKNCQEKHIYLTEGNDGAIINKTETPLGSRKDPTLSDRINNKLLKMPYSVTDEKLGFDDKNTSKDKCPKNEESSNILASPGYISNSPNEGIQVESDSHSTLSEDIGQFSLSHEEVSVCMTKTHKATLVDADVSENLSESVSETNMSESTNHKLGFTSKESLEGNSDTMTAGASSTSRTTTEQQLCEIAEKNKVFQVKLKKSESGNYGFSLVPALHNNHNRLFIKSISESGAVAQDGNLHVGDWLLQVNGTCVIGFSVKKVVSLLQKQSAATLTLTVHRSKCSDNCSFKDLVRPDKNTSLESSSNISNCSSDDDKTEVLQENLNMNSRQQRLASLENGCQVTNQNTIKDHLDKLKDDLNWLRQIPLVKVPQTLNSKVLLETQIYLLEALGNKHYKNEFQSLKQVKPSNSASNVAHLEQNQKKNRFHNIVPCTISRSLRSIVTRTLIYKS